MKIIIRNNDNITLEESVQFVADLLNSKSVDKLIEECEKSSNKSGPIYTRGSLTNSSLTLCWAQLNKSSLTINVGRQD